MHRKWVVNSSPLIILGKLSSLCLFEKMCPNLVIPEGVAHELDQGPVNDPARVWIHREAAPPFGPWIRHLHSFRLGIWVKAKLR